MSDTVTLSRSVIEDTIHALERYAVKRQDFERFESELAMLKAALAAPQPMVTAYLSQAHFDKAFPTSTQVSQNNTTGETTTYQYLSDGMTLRDYFAARAMQAEYHLLERRDQFKACAEGAYQMADAMLAAREAK